MTDRAYAKINLTLDIVGKREDGYHELKSVMQEVSVFDTVSVTSKKCVTGKGSVLLRLGNVRNLPTDDHNLCVKAAKAFFNAFEIDDADVDILLEKEIPLAAGMGGGSSDAAAVLRMMNREFNVNANDEELERIGATVGADVPFFIKGCTQVAEGIGDRLTQIPFDRKEIYVLARPEADISTPKTYSDFDALTDTPECKTDDFIEAIKNGNNPYEHLGNQLMAVTARNVPAVNVLKSLFEEMGGRAMMTGSGATVYGVFKNYIKAKKAADAARQTGLTTFVKVCLPITKR